MTTTTTTRGKFFEQKKANFIHFLKTDLKCKESEEIAWYLEKFDTSTVLKFIHSNFPQENLDKFLKERLSTWDLTEKQRSKENMDKLELYITLFKEFLKELGD